MSCSLRAARGPIDDGTAQCQQLDGTADKRWDGSFPWSDQAHSLLREFFGSRDFRLNQRQALNATMSGLDCFVLMPTGGGMKISCGVRFTWKQRRFRQITSSSLKPKLLCWHLHGAATNASGKFRRIKAMHKLYWQSEYQGMDTV